VPCSERFSSRADSHAARIVGQDRAHDGLCTIWIFSRRMNLDASMMKRSLSGPPGGRGVKRHTQLAMILENSGHRPGHGDVVAETMQTEREFCALVIGAAAGEQRIQMKESKW